MSGVLAAACCCRGTIPPGNPVCVPITGKLDGQFTFSAVTDGYVRGNPVGVGFETSLCELTPGVYGNLLKWTGWDNSIGPFKGRWVMDGMYSNGGPVPVACDPNPDFTLDYHGGSWNATVKRNPFTEQYEIISESNTFDDEQGGITILQSYCRQLQSNASGPTCVTAEGSGLYDVIRLIGGGFTNSSTYYTDQQVNAITGALECGYDSSYPRSYYCGWGFDAWYIKPVPFTATRTLTGTYTRYVAKVVVPLNLYGSRYASSQYPYTCGASTTKQLYKNVTPGIGGCSIDCGDYPSNLPECLYGTANGFGFTIPPSITVA